MKNPLQMITTFLILLFVEMNSSYVRHLVITDHIQEAGLFYFHFFFFSSQVNFKYLESKHPMDQKELNDRAWESGPLISNNGKN